jgi:hypothetical protein
MTGTPDLTSSDIIAAAEALPRWRTGGASPYGSSTMLVDRGHAAGLVLLGHSSAGWYATYYENHHTYRKELLEATSPFYDDGIYSEMAKMGVPDPLTILFPPDDPASTLRQIEQMRDQELLADSTVRRFRDQLAEALRECLAAPGDPWESTGSLDAPGGGYVQWTRVDEIGTPVHIEVSDGSDYSEPLDPQMVRLLVELGWQAPDEEFRNAWTRAQRPDDIARATALVATTLVVALGTETWRLTWDRLTG